MVPVAWLYIASLILTAHLWSALTCVKASDVDSAERTSETRAEVLYRRVADVASAYEPVWVSR